MRKIIIIIIIIIINCNWVVSRWQWVFYVYIEYEIDCAVKQPSRLYFSSPQSLKAKVEELYQINLQSLLLLTCHFAIDSYSTHFDT